MCLAVPGRVIEVQGLGPDRLVGRVDFGGVVKSVDLTFVPEARAGDHVVVHVGVALARLDPAEVERTLRLLSELEERSA